MLASVDPVYTNFTFFSTAELDVPMGTILPSSVDPMSAVFLLLPLSSLGLHGDFVHCPRLPEDVFSFKNLCGF